MSRIALTGTVIVESDGASRGNPGPAGAGYLVSQEGHVLAKGKRYLGISTNNVAEYQGMILGLEKALDLGADEVRALSDSLLVVRQVQGRYRVRKDHLKPLHRRCMDLAGRFRSFSIEYVPSSRNRAHALAEAAASR